LHIPVFWNYFFGSKKPFLTGFLRISFFSWVFQGNFSQECVCGRVTGIHFFFNFTGIFRRNSCGQEFLYLLRIPEDSGGFLFPPNPPEDLP
jgi:hypothetical protein